MIKYILTISLLFSVFLGMSQEDRSYVRKGNKLYEKEDYVGASENYLKALEKNNQSVKADFNLGDALYKQKKFAEAAQQFQKIAEKTTDSKIKADAYHNMGNSMLQAEKYQESINAYKQSLKVNPTDDETRYNLAYAKKKLQEQQQQENKDKDKKDDKKDQDKKDDKNKDKDKDKDKKDQDKKDQENKDKSDDKKDGEKDKDQQPQPNQLSKQQAQQMLDALNNQEKKVQAKLKKKKETGQKNNIEKDW